MKKLFAIAALGLFSFSAAHAQQNDKMLFNHLAVGITTGTPGLIGFDIATTCTPYLQIRAGLAIMPKFKYNTDIHVNANEYNNKINDMPAGYCCHNTIAPLDYNTVILFTIREILVIKGVKIVQTVIQPRNLPPYRQTAQS